ncbi:MAG: electron transfer flavoprotein subunit beta/FixA family protein [Clostridia bacterium]|nr:electron transfer flavoprotein subunit beta/FixA family protein [Clostridia bacterium]
MRITVCIKQVPDTNEVKIDSVTGTLIRDGVPSIMNPDDKAGLEAALELRDKYGAEVSVITMGLPQAEEVLREALAMGADKAYLLTDRKLGGADTIATSTALAAAISKIGFDLIITGRQAIDGDTAQVGPQIAEKLNIPNISYAQEIEFDGNDTIRVKRMYEDRYHIINAKLPCLITALGDMNTPRYMTPGGIKSAYETEITVWGRNDIDVDDMQIGLVGSPTKVAKSFPKALKGAGQKTTLDGEEAADYIISALKEKLIIR